MLQFRRMREQYEPNSADIYIESMISSGHQSRELAFKHPIPNPVYSTSDSQLNTQQLAG